jgi:hypothetical protein
LSKWLAALFMLTASRRASPLTKSIARSEFPTSRLGS